MTPLSTCRSCGGKGWWLRHYATGNLALIEPTRRDDDGNVSVALERGEFRVLNTKQMAFERPERTVRRAFRELPDPPL